MIRRQPLPDGAVKVTFALPDAGEPVSVIADFNGWSATAHPLKKRSNGTRSIAVELPPGSQVRFRYLDRFGVFFDDPEADGYEPNGFGQTHAVLTV
jgi:1,4-alpha-glucan branching enzyme